MVAGALLRFLMRSNRLQARSPASVEEEAELCSLDHEDDHTGNGWMTIIALPIIINDITKVFLRP